MQKEFGKIKVYGKIIDLDNTPVNELLKIRDILDNRLKQLCEEYVKLYNNG